MKANLPCAAPVQSAINPAVFEGGDFPSTQSRCRSVLITQCFLSKCKPESSGYRIVVTQGADLWVSLWWVWPKDKTICRHVDELARVKGTLL